MKLNIINSIFSSVVLILFVIMSAECFSADWVRIGVNETGIYSISYEKLKEMGFSDPSGVGVTGKGAKVLHAEEKLFFYGEGPENVSFFPDMMKDTKGYFDSKGRNTYSEFGYYYLTDDADYFNSFEKESTISSQPKELTMATTYCHHEEDLYQNSTLTGNLFWGESFNGLSEAERKWTVSLYDADPFKNGYLKVIFYSQPETLCDIEFGTDVSGGKFSVSGISSSSPYYFEPLPDLENVVPLRKGENIVNLKYSSSGNKRGVANLDYWILSYGVKFDDMTLLNGKILALPEITKQGLYSLPTKVRDHIKAMDITDSRKISLLGRHSGTGSGVGDYLCIDHKEDEIPRIVIFDITKKQKEISYWEKIDNPYSGTSLEEMASKGADMIIIAPDFLKEASLRLASLHKDIDGKEVAVISISELYSQLSEGDPDPEAYRKLVSLFANLSGKKPENLLLIGPIASDVRKMTGAYGYGNVHIMPQESTVHIERGANAVPDYYCIINDNKVDINDIDNYKRDIGIGFLPFYDTQEADDYINKLGSYLYSSPIEKVMNEWLFIGGEDAELDFTSQSSDLMNNISNLSSNSLITSWIPVEIFGPENSGKQFKDYLNRGKGVVVYVGHGAESMYGKDNRFFTTADVSSLKNAVLPLIVNAACSTSGTDGGRRGIAEEWVIGSKNGAIASIGSIRETLTEYIYYLCEKFLSDIVSESNSDSHLTIGEILANSKNQTGNKNDLSVILFGDPSIVLPFPRSRINISAEQRSEEDVVIIQGEVLKNSERDLNFNGNALLKIIEPETTVMVSEKEIHISDRIIGVYECEINEGEFEFSIYGLEDLIPDGGNYKIYAVAIDEDGKISHVGSTELKIEKKSPLDIVKDNIPPKMEWWEYDGDRNELRILLSDDKGVRLVSADSPVMKIILDNNPGFLSFSPVRYGEDGRETEIKVVLPSLSEGEHAINIYFEDFGGNKSSAEFTFSAGETFEPLNLKLSGNLIHGEGNFIVEGGNTNSNVYIYDSKGYLKRKLPVTGESVLWDGKDSRGNLVEPGLYKAQLIEENSDSGLSRSSSTIPVPFLPVKE